MQIKLPDMEEYIDVTSTIIVGDSKDYTIMYKTECGDVLTQEVEDIADSRTLLRTIAVLETMIKNNQYVKFDIIIK